ncbi:MAG: hypothetical protein CM15mV5_2440 [uncultured marine virus]|nr:MAG: hypothetical protein CM15mV5_2440 [uncultured marine virus]
MFHVFKYLSDVCIHSKSWNGKYIEISEDTAKLGSSLFSEVRETAKLWEVSGLVHLD